MYQNWTQEANLGEKIINRREEKWKWSPEAAETLREAKGGDLEDIRERVTPANVTQPTPAVTNGRRVERSAAEMSSVGELMDLKTDQVISVSPAPASGTKEKDQIVEGEREREVGEEEDRVRYVSILSR